MVDAGLFGGSAWPTPNQIPNLALWMDADNDASFSVDSFTGEVNSWTSREGNSRVFTPVNATVTTRLVRARKPNWRGRRVVVGQLTANTGLACPSFDMSTLFGGVSNKEITIIAALRTEEGVQQFGTLIYQSNDGGAKTISVQTNANPGQFQFLALDGGAGGGPLDISPNTPFLAGENILCLQRDSSSQTAFLNGAQQATTSSVCSALGSGTDAAMYIGASTVFGGGFHGDIAEIMVYNRSITSTERNRLENYLASKWLGIN